MLDSCDATLLFLSFDIFFIVDVDVTILCILFVMHNRKKYRSCGRPEYLVFFIFQIYLGCKSGSIWAVTNLVAPRRSL